MQDTCQSDFRFLATRKTTPLQDRIPQFRGNSPFQATSSLGSRRGYNGRSDLLAPSWHHAATGKSTAGLFLTGHLEHVFSLRTLGANLALPSANGHIAAIELRPNDLARRAQPGRTDDFSPNLERTAWAPASLHTYLRRVIWARNREVVQKPKRLGLSTG